jgi:multidrug efflux pump subunit AcrA (membrane-fusion protein)
MNPDIKLFPVYVSIDGSHEWIKPNMSAQVEIFVKHLDDVIHVPIQAVTSSGGQRVCYVVDSLGRRERRVIETGDFNNEFIEIKAGLKEGEVVLLRAPDSEQLREAADGRRPEEAQQGGRQQSEPTGAQGRSQRRGGDGSRPPRAG